jgi:hypothetical protein
MWPTVRVSYETRHKGQLIHWTTRDGRCFVKDTDFVLCDVWPGFLCTLLDSCSDGCISLLRLNIVIQYPSIWGKYPACDRLIPYSDTCLCARFYTSHCKYAIRWGHTSIPLTFCSACIIVYQCSETNVMHFLFNLLRTMGLYMFRGLLAHPQDTLHKRHLVYCVRVMSGGCTTPILVQPTDITRTQYTECRLRRASWGWASNVRNM